MSNYIEQTALSQDKPAGLRALNCAASLSNGLLTLEDGTSVELADLVDFVKGVASKVIPSSNDAEHDLLVEVIGEAGAVLNQSGVRRILSNYIDHPASGKTGTFAAKYDQHAERNGQTFTVLGAVDPSTYDADECGEMFTIRFADGVQIDAWPEEVQSAMNVSNYIEQPINATIQAGVLTLPNGQSIDLTKVQAALNFGFKETGDHDQMEACDEMSKLSGLVQGPSGEFVPAGDQQNAAMPRTGPDLTGVDAYALQRELERRGLLVQLWSPEDFEFIGNEDEEAADLSGDTLEQIQHQAFEQCRRSLDEITAQRGNEHLGDWWAMNKQPILEQFKPKDEYPRPGM